MRKTTHQGQNPWRSQRHASPGSSPRRLGALVVYYMIVVYAYVYIYIYICIRVVV